MPNFSVLVMVIYDTENVSVNQCTCDNFNDVAFYISLGVNVVAYPDTGKG